jgi:hypothetical protein
MKIVAGALVAAALAIGSGCANTDWIERTLVTVDVTGVWDGTVRLELQQQGPNVTGYFRAPLRLANWEVISGPIEGSVAGDVFRFKDARDP